MKTLHLVITNLCDRTCKHCCNKQYDVPNLAYVTDDDFKASNILCLTGGEPFVYSNPCNIARRYKKDYPHLEAVLVYTNAKELYDYLCEGGKIHDIDGLNISIKNLEDAEIFNTYLSNNETLSSLPMNRVYDFTSKAIVPDGFEPIERKWQKDFVPADNCIFKRGN